MPYDLDVHGSPNFSDGTFTINFGSKGKTAVYQVRSGNSSLGPWTYTVGTGAEISDTWPITGNGMNQYDLSVNGPNGFLRSYKGSVSGEGASNLDVRSASDRHGNAITISVVNRGTDAVTVRVTDAYTGEVHTHTLKAGAETHWNRPVPQSFGWYDFIVEVASDSTLRYELAGHLETGEESRTDPGIASTI